MKRPDFPRLLNDQDLFGLLTTPRMGKMRALALSGWTLNLGIPYVPTKPKYAKVIIMGFLPSSDPIRPWNHLFIHFIPSQRIRWDGINRGIPCRGTSRRQAQWCSPGHGLKGYGLRPTKKNGAPMNPQRAGQFLVPSCAHHVLMLYIPFKVIGLTWLLVKSWQRSSQTSGLVLAGWHKNTHLKQTWGKKRGLDTSPGVS